LARKSLNIEGKGDPFVVWKFIVTYVVLMAIALLIIGLESVKRVVDINDLYSNMIVHVTALLLKPFGIVEGARGSIIDLKGITLNVRFGCNGLEAFVIYAVAIISFPAATAKKLWGILAGFVIIQLLNIIRILALGITGVYFKTYFEYIHIYVAQGIMIALALVLFLVWLNYATEK